MISFSFNVLRSFLTFPLKTLEVLICKSMSVKFLVYFESIAKVYVIDLVLFALGSFCRATTAQSPRGQEKMPMGKQYPFDCRFFHRAITGTHFKNVFTYLIVHIVRK